MSAIHYAKRAYLAVFAALLLLSAGTVHAQYTSAKVTAQTTKTSQAVCGKSTLTQEQFLDMIHTIAMHGDLADKAFIEKTLKVKFEPVSKASAYSHIPGGGFYQANMPGDKSSAPWISLDTGIVSPDKTGDIDDLVTFGGLSLVGSVFHNCQYLTGKQFEHKFGGTFRDGAGVFKIQDLGKVRIEGSDIEIVYSHGPSDAIEKIHIHQRLTHITNK
jgi:hypothetical protein